MDGKLEVGATGTGGEGSGEAGCEEAIKGDSRGIYSFTSVSLQGRKGVNIYAFSGSNWMYGNWGGGGRGQGIVYCLFKKKFWVGGVL